MITLLLHAAALATMAMLPWGDFSERNSGDGSLVMIGKLPKNVLLDQTTETFETEELPSQEDDLLSDFDESELFSPTIEGELAEQAMRTMAFSLDGENNNDFQWQSFTDSKILAGGDEDFSMLVSQLNRDGLDVVITFDSTGSMQGEIDQVKSQISRIGSVLFKLIERTRLGICTYRDYGDEYIVDGLPLTDNLAEIVLFLEKVNAGGGGDEPEAVEKGLEWSTSQDFRRSARKVILLFGDAPPRPGKSLQCEKTASDFRKIGGIVSTVTCRKTSRLPDFVRIAKSGSGEAFLTANERQIMAQLIILVFGSQHRIKVIEAFDLLNN